jgi:hypothetical protein
LFIRPKKLREDLIVIIISDQDSIEKV